MIYLSEYDPRTLSAHSHLGEPYLEIGFGNQADAEKFYEDVKLLGFTVPKDVDLKMNEDESLGLTTVILDCGALMEINEPAKVG